MARQISSHREVADESIAPQDVHGDLSSNKSNVAVGNSLIPSGLKFGTIIFKNKYIVDMDKFTTAGLSSKIFYRGALLLHGKEEKMKSNKIHQWNFLGVISILTVVFYYFHVLVSYLVVIHDLLSSF